MQSNTLPIDVASPRRRAHLLFPPDLERNHRDLCRMRFGFGVSMLSLVEPRSLNACLHRLTSRFFLNLRSIAYHQQPSEFESHLSFEPSHVRPHSVRNQSGRLMRANFVGFGMHKTVYSSTASPDEGEVEQADIFHLEVIDSQADRQPLKDQG